MFTKIPNVVVLAAAIALSLVQPATGRTLGPICRSSCDRWREAI
jgi:hypothetical protein